MFPTLSHLGGAVMWPVGRAWPRCPDHDVELITVLQLLASDVPELGFPDGSDIFQLLWCALDHDEHPWLVLPFVHWHSLEDDLEPRVGPAPDMASEDHVPAVCALWPERIDDLPHSRELDASLQQEVREWLEDNLGRLAESDQVPRDIDEFRSLSATSPVPWGEEPLELVPDPSEDLYWQYFGAAPGCKVGGWPNWIQDPEYPTCACGAQMEHLLTISSDEVGSGPWRWALSSERHLWRGAQWVTIERPGGSITSGRTDNGHQWAQRAVDYAAGLMLGDVGDLYLFRHDCTVPPQFSFTVQMS